MWARLPWTLQDELQQVPFLTAGGMRARHWESSLTADSRWTSKVRFLQDTFQTARVAWVPTSVHTYMLYLRSHTLICLIHWLWALWGQVCKTRLCICGGLHAGVSQQMLYEWTNENTNQRIKPINNQRPKIIHSVLSVSIKTVLQTHCELDLFLHPGAKSERTCWGLGDLNLEKMEFKLAWNFFWTNVYGTNK